MIEYHPGENIFDSRADCLVNPVNTVGVMGAGLALAFRRKYPANYLAYKDYCDRGQLSAGGVFAVVCDGKLILNVATKEHWRNPSKLEWIKLAMPNIVEHLDDISSIAIPPLGAGLGGLMWPVVRAIILRTAQRYPEITWEIYGTAPTNNTTKEI